MLYSDNDQHHKPHFHVFYAEYEASVSVDGEVLAGSLPLRQLRLVQAWATIHEDELYAAWNNAVRNIPFGKSPPALKRGVLYVYSKWVVYAQNPAPLLLKVSGVRPLSGHRFWLRFSDGAENLQFLAPSSEPAFSPLRSETLFRSVCLDHSILTWADGEIDIAPEYLYAHGCAQGVRPMPDACCAIIDRLIEERRHRQMTQKQLADAAGLTQSVIARPKQKRQPRSLIRCSGSPPRWAARWPLSRIPDFSQHKNRFGHRPGRFFLQCLKFMYHPVFLSDWRTFVNLSPAWPVPSAPPHLHQNRPFAGHLIVLRPGIVHVPSGYFRAQKSMSYTSPVRASFSMRRAVHRLSIWAVFVPVFSVLLLPTPFPVGIFQKIPRQPFQIGLVQLQPVRVCIPQLLFVPRPLALHKVTAQPSVQDHVVMHTHCLSVPSRYS